MSRLENKTALITGGTSGIGLETARQFIAEGARVAVTGTNPKNIAEVRAILGEAPLIIEADAGNVAGQAAVAEKIRAAFGTLDILFVNAGIAKLQRDYEGAWGQALKSLAVAGRIAADARIARLMMLGALNWSVQWYKPRQGASLDELSEQAMRLFVPTSYRRAT